MADPNYNFIATPPVPPTSGADWNVITPIAPDLQTFSENYFDPDIVATHVATWVPDMNGWDLSYDEEGAATITQNWIASYYAASADGTFESVLPFAVKQLLSWNREKYAQYATFFDSDFNASYEFDVPQPGTSIAYNISQPLVPVRIRVTPRVDLLDKKIEAERNYTGSTTLVPFSKIKGAESEWDDRLTGDDYLTSIRKKLLVYDAMPVVEPSEIKSVRPVFPRMRSQFYNVQIEFARDRYVNRYGIRYAAVDVRPSVRLLSLKNIPMAIVPTGADGQPDFTALYQVVGLNPPGGNQPTPAQTTGQAQLTEAILEKVDTGFPVRESQLEIRVTYPWVSMEQLLDAGPIGNLDQLSATGPAEVEPFKIPDGLYLGAVNSTSFLGYSRGRVLYNGCELTPKQSPVSGKLGYMVTHEFLINPNMEWNQTRYTGTYNPSTIENPINITGNAIAWRTGYMCMQPSRVRQETVVGNQVQSTYAPLYTIKLATDNDYHAIYPYPYMDFNELDNGKPALLYYGMVGDGNAPNFEG